MPLFNGVIKKSYFGFPFQKILLFNKTLILKFEIIRIIEKER